MDELKKLMNAKLRAYKITTFKNHLADKHDWGTSKRQRVVKRTFIVVYSLWNKKLLARTFYVEEGYYRKEKYQQMEEVQRQVGGNSRKIYRCLSSSLNGMHICFSAMNWNECQHDVYEIIRYESWSYIIDAVDYNDPFQYLNKSIHKYSAAELIYNPKEHYINVLFRYLVKYDKHPQLEMVVKMGLKHLLNETRLFRWSKKGINILGVERCDIKYLRSGISLSDYRKFEKVTISDKLDINELKLAIRIGIDQYDKKLVKYLTKQDVSHLFYRDYLRFVDQLGLPKRNSILYPSNLINRHDEFMDEIEVIENETNDKLILDQYEKLKNLIFEKNDLIVLPVKCSRDLIVESKELNHCVRTYIDRVATGETEIMVLRKHNENEVPYYTIELKDKKIIQIRGKNNKSPSEDVNEFVDAWCKYKNLKNDTRG